MEFGASVELEPGVQSLIHISELSPTRVRRVADIVQLGQEVERPS
jgi:ribosomal protein S1